MSDSRDLPSDLPELFRTSALGPDSREARRLSRAAARGVLLRVHTGVYCRTDEWGRLGEADRHRLRLRATLPSLDDRFVVSHRSALALHGLPTLGEWPSRVHVTDSAGPNGHADARVVKHGGPLADDEIQRVDGLRVTCPVRAVTDVARTESFASAVVSADAALRLPGVTLFDLQQTLDAQSRRHGAAAARRVVEFASPRSDSVGESWCRCRLAELGAPTPELQYRFDELRGEVGPVDFWFADAGVILEFDGDLKYLDARYRNGRTAEQVVLRERRRERKLLALRRVRDVVRVDWRDLVQLWRLRRLVVDAGVAVR